MDSYIFFFSVIALFMIYRLVALALKRRSGESCPATVDPPASEAEMLRELHHGLARMEKRIEALETLLVERGEADRVTAGQKRP